ncbi:zeatin o-xylosyltransferase [Phtheirospermum japonicum]|uniref:Glycosyltransferase n=2 Tax=Phtheirospermum japonicum TaxID=374723 RepID=A0A830D839_9LAMI|nr:zeatin o-xylosyltransferase [Phtheirospermum japonicum]
MLQLSCLISSYNIPVHYVGSATHNRQARTRANGLNPSDVAKIHFHNSTNRFPAQLQPAWDATMSLRGPIAGLMVKLSSTHKRVIVIHDPLIASVVQDVATIPNAESYAFNCLSGFCEVKFIYEQMGKTCPLQRLRELPLISTCISDGLGYFIGLQNQALEYRAGDLYNTCRLMEGPFLDILGSQEVAGNRKSWAIGPLLPAKFSPAARHECLKWLDRQEPRSVIYVTFGTTCSLTDEEINELATGLERSGHKFLWVLRDADKGDVFDGEIRNAELPPGFEERVGERGMVVRDWAPQPEILAHKSTGGFMSHCGWNSCIESITMGVPIAAWPMHSDQPTNAVLVTEILKVGLAVREWTEIVKAPTIESVVKRLMDSEEGEEVRKRAQELAVVVRRATEEGGASRVELDSFIAHICRDDDQLPKSGNNILHRIFLFLFTKFVCLVFFSLR